ncbi:MAG: aminotransferase class V-fold PLP-dependent enzyme [Candidatus Woesearchaeota archaeon]
MNIEKIREDFPVLKKGIIYADSACMSLKPLPVIEASLQYYYDYPGCAGRSHHTIGRQVTDAVDQSRKTIASFFNAKPEEIIFTRNTTESINLVSQGLYFEKGDVIVTSDKEHNSNLLPWQKLAKQKGITHKILHSSKNNEFDLELFKEVVQGAKLVSLVYTSNLDGITYPIKEITKIAHRAGALVLVDAAQAASHMKIDVKKLNVDFLACSGHKIMGPSGIGCLYGKYELLRNMEPFMVGGETVFDSTYNNAEYELPPKKFEAGLQNYAGIVGFAEATKYVQQIGFKKIQKHLEKLNQKLTKDLSEIEGIQFISNSDPKSKAGIVSFTIEGVDSHELAIMLNSSMNIMCRSGAHCVHSWFNAHKMDGCIRFSLYIYNTVEECEVIAQAVKESVKILKK